MQNRKKGKRKCKFFYALPQYFQKNILNFSYALFTNFLLPFFCPFSSCRGLAFFHFL